MLVVFVVSLFLPKEWLVSGKVVVFPSGQPSSASVNLLPEVGNTAEIIKSEAFQNANFGDFAVNFAGTKALKGSSIVWVKFRSPESDIEAFEDMIVKIPAEVDEYARDLYSGSPFKYRLVSDPEISASPVRPNLLLNAILGFLAGILIYLIYWFGFESNETEAEVMEVEKDESNIVSPEMKPAEMDKSASSADKVGQGKVELIDGRPHFVPEKTGDTKSAAPDNLPFVDEASSPSNIQEPSDQEVKDRLNRLMRGEL